MRLLVVCGLNAEAAIAAGPGVETLVGGGRAAWLRDALAAAIAERRPHGVLSFGIAGALGPDLRAGDLAIGSSVTYAGESFDTDPPWREALRRSLSAPERSFAGIDTVAASAADKAALRTLTGADAVDMESGPVATACHHAGLPFAIIRAISDESGTALSPSAVSGMGAEGEVRVGAVLASLLRRPQDVSGLVRMGIGSAAAFRALRDARGSLGAGLAFTR